MPTIEEVARVIEGLLLMLARGPAPRPELRERFVESPKEYDDAMGALRVLGLAATGTRKMVSLTALGLYAVEHSAEVPASAIVSAFRTYRGKCEGAESYAGAHGLPTQEALVRGLSSVSMRSVRDLMNIRNNVLSLLERNLAADIQFGLGLYITAIDREFEIRPPEGSGDEWFPWPSTDAPEGFGTMAEATFMPEGMLGAMEYRVGIREGLPDDVRRRLLDQMFERVLPPLFPRWYMDKWGIRGTAPRLRTLAYTIAQLTKLLKHKRDDRMEAAIRDYEDDLAYLYEKYYVGRFHFDWPSTSI